MNYSEGILLFILKLFCVKNKISRSLAEDFVLNDKTKEELKIEELLRKEKA